MRSVVRHLAGPTAAIWHLLFFSLARALGFVGLQDHGARISDTGMIQVADVYILLD
jgi:hypothetical protein